MLSFQPSAEQQELARVVRRFLAEHAPVARARELMEDPLGYDPHVFAQMGAELGLQGLHVPARYGGAGAGYADLGVVLEAMGAVLYSGPFLASAVLATEVLLASGDAPVVAELVPEIAAGRRVAALALGRRPGAFDESALGALAEPTPSGWRLSGCASFVLHGDAAAVLVVPARGPAGVSVFLVDADAPGLTLRADPVLDQTRHLASLQFEEAPARLAGADGTAWPAVESALDRAAVALACDALGVAQQSLDLTVAYAIDRQQFGRPIGSFQVIKHKCADMLVAVELARSGVCYATRAIDSRSPDSRTAASLALAQAAEAAQYVTGESIQIHGGIGFTWEHDAHLYFKRARADAAFFGTVAFHRERMLRSIGV